MMHPEESFELSRCVYRSYGYSYDWDYIYYPTGSGSFRSRAYDLLRRGNVGGRVRGASGRNGTSRLARWGVRQAVVDPRFRGHHLFPKMKTFMAQWAADAGMYGLYSEATAVHPYSQRGNLHLGARETGFLLGYIPASVSYKQIGDERADRRGSVALFYMRVRDEPEREIYPPAPYLEEVSGSSSTTGCDG